MENSSCGERRVDTKHGNIHPWMRKHAFHAYYESSETCILCRFEGRQVLSDRLHLKRGASSPQGRIRNQQLRTERTRPDCQRPPHRPYA